MKRREDCGGRAGEHVSGKDCYTDELERQRAEAREKWRDEERDALSSPIISRRPEAREVSVPPSESHSEEPQK